MEEQVPEGQPPVWPPPPTGQKLLTGIPPQKPRAGLVSACLSGVGLLLIVIGASGPDKAGLSGLAFMNAFEADEALMMRLIAGILLSSLGLVTGLFHCRNWSGKAAIVLALLASCWLLVRHNHF